MKADSSAIEEAPDDMKAKLTNALVLTLSLSAIGVQAQPAQPLTVGKAVPVTVDNFNRAESDLQFHEAVKDGGFGKFAHYRDPVAIGNQPVVRPNRDMLYSIGVFDLDAGPVMITLPDAGNRFRSMQVIDEDQYTLAVNYGAGDYTFTKETIGTRYVLIAVRTLVDAENTDDIGQVHALQDAIKVSQKSAGSFETPNWDQVSQKMVRNALLALASTVPKTTRMFGTRDQVDPVHHLIGTALGWGGNPEKAALYLDFTTNKNDGNTIYRLRIRDVPVDGFWSISVYNAQGYFQPNERDVYTLNNVTAKKSEDGSIVVQFGGCDGETPNCLPTVPGWSYTVRLYRPRTEILNGKWTFPEASAVDQSNEFSSP